MIRRPPISTRNSTLLPYPTLRQSGPSSLLHALSSWPELAQLAHVAPRRTPRAMFSDEVLEGDDIDLSRLPIQRCRPGHVGRLVTLGLVITRGTRKPRQNIGIYRMPVVGRDPVLMTWLPPLGGAPRSPLCRPPPPH